jgi:hypothetical protein
LRELDGSGVPLEGETNTFFALWAESNGNRPLSVSAVAVAGYHLPTDVTPGNWGWGAELNLSLRPHPALETRLEFSSDRTPYAPRFVEQVDEERFVLGSLRSDFLSLTLRQQWVISPRLTLQGYAQLFTAYGVYGPFFEGTSNAARAPIRYASLVPVERADSDSFYDVALNVNAVLRWEYRLGSTFFLVYSRSQQGLPTPDGVQPPATVAPRGLLAGPANDAVMLKWSYYWSV